MALTGMQIYKLLPKTNCKDCALPTCMAFAMQVAAKQKALTDCPHVSAEAQAQLSDASAPPMKKVTIGTGDAAVVIGQETVMFRHEEKFHHRTAIAVRVPASLNDAAASALAEKIKAAAWTRVGEQIRVGLAAVEIDGCADAAARAKSVADACGVPLILMGADAARMQAAVTAVKAGRPLVYPTAAAAVEPLAAIAGAAKLPLAVMGADLAQMADLTGKARAKGVEELVLAFSGADAGGTIRTITIARRAAIKKSFRALGYPALVDVVADTPELETVLAATFAVKYASIVVVRTVEPWALLPVLAAIQNIYTDPQKPNAVEAKLYEIGNPNENSPVLFTTNFSLTYFSVEGEVVRSKIPAYICVVETEGLGVLNSYAGDKISAEKVIKTLKDQGVAAKVKHRRLIIPGLLPIFRAEIEEGSEWKEVLIGPESAGKIPAFLNEVWR
ncbi:MAG: acetyl-CoA decarbonylase/synthase complex subunit gamma [Planctomycetota bacterium]